MAPRRLSHCCCFTVRTGALIIATFGIIGALINVGVLSLILGNDDKVFMLFDQIEDKAEEEYRQGEITADSLVNIRYYCEMAHRYLPVVLGVGIALAAVSLLKHCLLMFGVLYKKHHAMLPWLALVLVHLILSVIGNIGYGIAMAVYEDCTFGALTILFSMPFFALGFYFWHAVFSHYKAVKEENRAGDRKAFVAEEVPPSYDSAVDVKY